MYPEYALNPDVSVMMLKSPGFWTLNFLCGIKPRLTSEAIE